MVFNNFYFMFLFFPLFYLIYYRIRKNYRMYVILIGSIVFYLIGTWKAPVQFVLLVLLTAIGVLGCFMFQRDTYRKKPLLALFVLAVSAPLIYVKLAGLFLKSAPSLPLGLSFYTFQLIAFLVYAYKGGSVDPAGMVSGVLFFPKLLSGPLAEPQLLLTELEQPKKKYAMINEGLQEFLIGLAYKVILADHLGGVLGKIRMRGVQAVSVPLAWLGLICYALQLYFDFCGYSKMAKGIAGMLGIHLPDNFRHPYCSVSIREFWQRWHITLGQWFKTHVYIPLGGSRNGTARLVISTLAVWLLTGIWHGAGWNYVLWGLMMFLLLMGERFLWGKWLEKNRWFGHIYVPLLIMLSWIFFITSGPAEAGHYFARLVGFTSLPYDAKDWITVLSQSKWYLILGILFAVPLPETLFAKIRKQRAGWIVLGAVFVVCIYFMSTAASDPFLYFNF